jgi:hypothetical protein
MTKRLFISVLCLLCFGARAAFFESGWDWEARNWRTNIAAQSGTISAHSFLTGNQFMQTTKHFAVRLLLGHVNLYLGDNTNAMCCPIITDWSGAGEINDGLSAFVASDFAEATGLTGNTTTKFLSPSKSVGLGLGSFTSINNVHSAVYVRTASNESSYCCGYASVGNCTFGMPISYAGNSWIEINLAGDSTTDTNGVGFYLSTRVVGVGVTNRVTYKNGVSLVASTNVTGALGTGAFVVHAFNSAGSVVAHTSRALSYYAVGYGIPAPLVTPYRIAVRNVQVSTFGRNVE